MWHDAVYAAKLAFFFHIRGSAADYFARAAAARAAWGAFLTRCGTDTCGGGAKSLFVGIARMWAFA